MHKSRQDETPVDSVKLEVMVVIRVEMLVLVNCGLPLQHPYPTQDGESF